MGLAHEVVRARRICSTRQYDMIIVETRMDFRVHMYIPDLNTHSSVTCSTIINGLKLWSDQSSSPFNLRVTYLATAALLSRSLCLASRAFLPLFTAIAFFFIHLGSLPSVKVVKSYCSMIVHLSTSIVMVTDMNQQTKLHPSVQQNPLPVFSG